jgi:hypothetical protein
LILCPGPAMSNFRQIDRETGFLLPPSVDEWLPERHLARFIVEVIAGLDLRSMSGSRTALQRRQGKLDPRRLVFIDETSVSTTITRLYGRAPQGERLVQKVLHGNWKTVTFIAALRHERVTAPFVLEGAMNGETFKAYVEQFLAPTQVHASQDCGIFSQASSVHRR